MKKILIANEKHGKRYFDASTPELLAAAAFKLLSERFEDGYYIPWSEKPDESDVLSDSQIGELPNERLRNAEQAKRAEYLRHLKEWEEESAEFEEIKEIVKNKNKSAAWDILRTRIEFEYEDVLIKVLEIAD